MNILNEIVGVLLDPTIHCCCICPIRHPLPFIKNWILQKIKLKCKQHDSFKIKKLIKTINNNWKAEK